MVARPIRGTLSSKGSKILTGKSTNCFKKSMTLSDKTIEAEGLKYFFKIFGQAAVNFGKNFADNPERALEIASKIGSATANKYSEAAFAATPESINFLQQLEKV